MNSPRRSTRLIAAVAAGAMAVATVPLFGMSPAGAADPLPPVASPTADGAFCDGAPSNNPFTDLGGETPSTRDAILCLVATELTSGTTATTYSPGDPVTRRQMALFIKRLADAANALESDGVDLQALPAYDGEQDHTDIAAEQPAFEEAIGQLTQAGIVGGFPDNTYRPNEKVSRRQMAAFINRLQEYLSGSAFTATGDYFDDDDGDSGEANLNALAEVGIFQGDGQGNVFPGADISRRQMANILLRHAQVNFAAGAIDSPFAAAPPTGLQVAPTSAQTIEYLAPKPDNDASDDRQYTVSNLTEDAYRITLVEAANISTTGGVTSFADDDDNNIADPGNTNTTADITLVNGTAVDTPARTVPASTTVPGTEIAPVNGTITFTVDGYATGSLRPVVYVNDGASSFLEVDDDGVPVEAFGVGGQIDYVPVESDDGAFANGTVTLVGDGYAVIDDAATVYFDGGDTYRTRPSNADQCVETTANEFFQNLTVGDGLGTFTQVGVLPVPANYNESGGSEFCLVDVAPAAPTDVTATAGDPADTVVDLTWTASTTPSVDSYTVYANDETCADTTVEEFTPVQTTDADTTEAELTGLTADTDYCFAVTATDDADESDLDPAEGDDITTADVLLAPTITSAEITFDAVNLDVAGLGDTFTLVFSEDMADTDATATITVTDGTDVTIIDCTNPAPADDGRTSASCSFADGPDADGDLDTLTITLNEAGDDANGNGTDPIDLPLTITATTNLTDSDAPPSSVDVAGSADTVID